MTTRGLERLAEPGAGRPGSDPYGPLLGAWDVVWRRFADDGEPGESTPGEWHFARVLGGYGVQDVIWAQGSGAEMAGTTLRCWDPGRQVWRSVFMSPGDGEFVSLVGHAAGGGIRQLVVDPVEPGAQREWNFSEIDAGSFLWRARVSLDGGQSWRFTHEIRGRRQA